MIKDNGKRKWKLILGLFVSLIAIALAAMCYIDSNKNDQKGSIIEDFEFLKDEDYTGKMITKSFKVFFNDIDLIKNDKFFYYHFLFDFIKLKRGDTISYVCKSISWFPNGFNPAKKVVFRRKYYMENGHINTFVVFQVLNLENEIVYSYKLDIENKENFSSQNSLPILSISVDEYIDNNKTIKIKGIDGCFDDVPELEIYSEGLHELELFDGN